MRHITSIVSVVTLASSFALGCSAAPVSEQEESTSEQRSRGSSVATPETETRVYRGSFESKGETYDLAFELTYQRRFEAQQEVGSTKFHLDQLGRCWAHLETDRWWEPNAFHVVQSRLTISYGGQTQELPTDRGELNVKKDLPRSECDTGLLENPRVETSLLTEVSVRGALQTVNGRVMSIPASIYGVPNNFHIEGQATYRAISQSVFTDRSDRAFTRSELITERGEAEISLPRTLKVMVGIDPQGNFQVPQEKIEVTLRAP